MKNRTIYDRKCIMIVVLCLFCLTSAVYAQTVPKLAEKALAATVLLEMTDGNGIPLGIGSGFFVKPNTIATNYHVIEGAVRGTAKLVGKNTIYTIEGVIAEDEDNDLSLLEVTAYGIKPLSLIDDSDTVKIGEAVYVAGNPKGLEGTFSDGIISSLRTLEYKNKRLQMTAPISPGSSGGPVLNQKGEVIGVSFAGLRALDAQNLNFAIPSNYLKKLLELPKPSTPLSQRKRPISAETYYLWGNVKYDLGNYEGAIADYTKAIQLKNDYAKAYNNRGMAKTLLKQYFGSITDYDMVIRLNPANADAYNNRGRAKLGLGQHYAAIVDFDMAIRLNPDFTIAYNNRGVAKLKKAKQAVSISDMYSEIRAAITDFDMAIRLRPDYAGAYINRGNAKNDLGDNFAAITDYDTAIRLNPEFALAYYNRGEAKFELNQYVAAITDYDMAIRLKPDSVKFYVARAMTKKFLGRKSEAKQDFLTALKLANQTGDAELKKLIEGLIEGLFNNRNK